MSMARVPIIDDDVELCRLLAERLSIEDLSIEALGERDWDWRSGDRHPSGVACRYLPTRHWRIIGT